MRENGMASCTPSKEKARTIITGGKLWEVS
jgi:hypothetical protein